MSRLSPHGPQEYNPTPAASLDFSLQNEAFCLDAQTILSPPAGVPMHETGGGEGH